MHNLKKQEICPGYSGLAEGSTLYSGEKFALSTADKRISDPVYDSGDEVQPTEDEETSEGTPAGVY